MQPSTVSFICTLAVLAGHAAAAPAGASVEPCIPRTKCVDAINKCGVRYGACYDVCKPELAPVAPLCVVSTPAPTATSTKVAGCDEPKTTSTPTTTSTVVPTTPTAPGCPAGKTGSGYMLCADYINACGMMYGGCFPDCKPWPTFVPPPCPSSVMPAVPVQTVN
ncbi:hypothetical protein QBC39DRAFT_370559 [Podospora conica]|nr:hypothetical protein QBC39DRAFT_370559 [Schizothecium conicum]